MGDQGIASEIVPRALPQRWKGGKEAESRREPSPVGGMECGLGDATLRGLRKLPAGNNHITMDAWI